MPNSKPSEDPIHRKSRNARREASTLSLKAADTSLFQVAEPSKMLNEMAIPNPFGRYQVLTKLGAGAMGVVYLAEDTQLGRKVALKIPRAAALQDPEALERSYREARTIAAVRHNNICQVYDVGEIGGIHFLSMEYVEGKVISSYVSASKPPAPKKIALLFRKIALALQEAHSQNVVHRDLKPSNVMLDGKGEPKVMDFGLACQMNNAEQARLTQTGAILGTPAYMAPEQVRGDLRRIGPRTDIYALGVMLYEFLTGERPFTGAVFEVCAKVLTEQPVPPSQRRAGVDSTLEALCLQMMAKDPDQRLPSMRDVADVLSAYIKSGPALGLTPAEGAPLQAGTSGALPVATGMPSSVHTPAASQASNAARKKLVLRIGFAGISLSLVCTIGALLFMFMLQERPAAPHPTETVESAGLRVDAPPEKPKAPVGDPPANIAAVPDEEPKAPPADDGKVLARLQLGTDWMGTHTMPDSAGEPSANAVTARVIQRDWNRFTLEVTGGDRIKRAFHGEIEHVGRARYVRLKSISPEYAGVVGRTSMASSTIALSGELLLLAWTAPMKAGPQKMSLALQPKTEQADRTPNESADAAEEPTVAMDDEDPTTSEAPDVSSNDPEMTIAEDSGQDTVDLPENSPLRGTKLTTKQFPASIRNDLKRAVDHFEASCNRHRKIMLEAFREQLKGKDQAVMETIRQEEERFRSRGWLPMSLAMRKYSFEFMRTLAGNPEYKKLSQAYLAANDQLERERKAVDAKLVADDFPRRALEYGRWQCASKRFGKHPTFVVELYSNGEGAAKAGDSDEELAPIKWQTDGSTRLVVADENGSYTTWVFDDDGLSFTAYDRSEHKEYTGRLMLPRE